MVNNENIKKVCSFYVSDWHLVTMLLPHINEKINEEVKIATILQYSLQKQIETLLEKLKIENKDKILNIDWREKIVSENIIENIINTKEDNIEIIINGDMEYIEKVNKQIENCIKNANQLQNKKITIIDCYNVNDYKNKISQIIGKHQKILNTSGEKDKAEYITNISVAK